MAVLATIAGAAITLATIVRPKLIRLLFITIPPSASFSSQFLSLHPLYPYIYVL